MSRRDRPIPASVEDVDEYGNIIEGTDRYASSVAPSSPATKEQPNTGRTRKEKIRRGSSSPIASTTVLTDSDSTVHPRRDALKKPSKDRDKSVSNSKKALMPTSRPSVKHAKTTPSIPNRNLEAVYYGVDPTVTPAPSRPRAQTRPASYYAPSRPPPANARFYASQTPAPSTPTSFPPPSWMGPGPGPGPGPAVPPYGPLTPSPLIMQYPPPPPPDYYTRPLESRFGSTRPQSAMGFRQPRAAIEYDDYEEPAERTLTRRPSTARKVSKNEEDRKAMPPPRRPASARPTALSFRPPPSAPARRSVGFDDTDPDLEDPFYRDLSPLSPASYEHNTPIPFRPRPSFGADISYDAPDFQTEVAGKGYRRHSYYGGNSASSGSAYEEKIRQAARYQDDVTGGAQLPLTAESLRKAGRNGGSSRSTRSSGSHDESEYRQSATTRTTRSSANDEDVTIRVKGTTVLKFGKAEMQCQDGAEINISRGGATEIRTGSDRSSYLDHDDRRTRIDFPTARARASSRSRARSYSRTFSKYESPDYDTYGYAAPLPAPYPAYPSSYSSRPDDGYFDAL
ncbi:hypothetical protein VTK56DRAFT_174 [Thermocarpiscus australiensis]